MKGVDFPKRYIFSEIKTSGSNTTTSAVCPLSAEAPGPPTSLPKQENIKRKAGQRVLRFFVGALVLCSISRRRKESGPSIFSLMINKADLAFLKKDDAVESLEIIGRGGCGEVYKSELPVSSGIMIAIKKIVAKLNEENTTIQDKKMRQLQSEIQTAGLFQHRNLVYEFMKNGSLQDVMSQVSRGTRELDWLSRYKIALGVASGLEYLHMSHGGLIIHRDLKPANILLDENMEAQISDFGLAKAMPDAKSHLTASNLTGTAGYIAPEYRLTLKFTDKCDIYSFGMILGVLVTGKLPYDDFFQYTAEMLMVKWMRNVMTSENPQQAIDPNLMGNGFEEQMLHVLRIAFLCTLEDPKQRPNSRDVWCMLRKIKH